MLERVEMDKQPWWGRNDGIEMFCQSSTTGVQVLRDDVGRNSSGECTSTLLPGSSEVRRARKGKLRDAEVLGSSDAWRLGCAFRNSLGSGDGKRGGAGTAHSETPLSA